LGVVWGCGGDDDGGGSGTGGVSASTGGAGGAGASTGGAGGGGTDLCEVGCVATMAAACANGPASQAVCVTDCRSLQNGACGTEYAALQACAVGESVTCSAAGSPIVAACATEQASFVACLN
jgi:hypothetical protein